jgi:peroxiredoxin
MFDTFAIDLGTDHGTGEWELPLPGSFVVDRDGVVRFGFAKAVYTQRAEPDDLLEVVRGL